MKVYKSLLLVAILALSDTVHSSENNIIDHNANNNIIIQEVQSPETEWKKSFSRNIIDINLLPFISKREISVTLRREHLEACKRLLSLKSAFCKNPKIEMTLTDPFYTPFLNEILATIGENIWSLSVYSMYDIDTIIKNIEFLRNLRILNLGGIQVQYISDNSIFNPFSTCKFLTHLKSENLNFNQFPVNHASLNISAENLQNAFKLLDILPKKSKLDLILTNFNEKTFTSFMNLIPPHYGDDIETLVISKPVSDKITHIEPEAFINAPFLKNLRFLSITEHGIDDSLIAFLSQIPDLHLEKLILSDNNITGDGVRILSESKSFSCLTVLNLARNQFQRTKKDPSASWFSKMIGYNVKTENAQNDVESLIKSKNLKKLKQLLIYDNNIDCKPILYLLKKNSSYLPKLTTLSLYNEGWKNRKVLEAIRPGLQ